MSRRSRARDWTDRWLGLALIWLSALALFGCVASSEAGPLWADPGVIRLDPDRTQVEVEIHNRSDMPRPLTGFELGGADWGSLRFLDDTLPRAIPAHGVVTVNVEVSVATLRVQPGVYRSGSASLTLQSDRHALVIPIELVGTRDRRPGAPPTWLALALLLGLGLIALAPGLPGERPRAWLAGLRGLARDPRAGLGALAAGLLLGASIPVGAGLCEGRTGARVGATELEACRDGLGGFPLQVLPASAGVWWWLIGAGVVALSTASLRAASSAGRIPGPATVRGLIRVLGFALALAAVFVGLAPASATPVDLVLAQLRTVDLGGVAVPAWGAVAQPLGFVAMFMTLATVAPSTREPSGALAIATRLERVLWAALLTTAFLGGWALPGLSGQPVPALTHGGMIALELLAFVAKVALVDLGLRRLSAALAAHGLGDGAWVRVQLRWAMPLLWLNLVLVTLWRLA